MYIYTFMGRAKSSEGAQYVCDIFGHLSSSELATQPGYRRGECAVSVDDPRQVFIHEHWGNLPSLQAWHESGAYRKAIGQATSYLEDGRFETHLYSILAGGPP